MKTYMPVMAIAATAVVSLMSCQPKQEKVMDFDISTQQFQWSDSVVSGKMVSNVDIAVTVPKESSTVYESVEKWIAARLGAKGEQSKMPVRKLMETIGNEYIDSIKSNIESLKAGGYDEPMPYTYSWNVSPVHFTNKYVTYTDTAYAYEGGAHGMSVFDAATFTLADGKQWGYDMFAQDKMEDLRRMVVDAIAKQYFKVADASAMEKDILVPVGEVKLPACPPYVTADGVAFTYQQYEIAPYSAGMPTCVLSLFDVHNLLNPEFAQYVSEP